VGAYASVGDHASVGAYASVGDHASVGDYASIGDRASMGADASIGDRASMGIGASMGDRTSIGDHASMGINSSIGDRTSIGDHTSMGADASMGFGSSIGPNVAVGCTATTGRCGTLLAFGWAFYTPRDGDAVLSYGCVTLTLAQWRKHLTALCEQHAPDVATYERAISALLDYADVEIAALDLDVHATECGPEPGELRRGETL
jgi:UDP-3-O-[3-hydroxymyristoyl] glucosamine N-acyltransferase